MSAKNKLANKQKRRAEREARKSTFESRRATQFKLVKTAGDNYQRVPMDITAADVSITPVEASIEDRLGDKGFIVAHQEDMLWKPGDED